MEQNITLIKGDKVDIETDYRDALPVNMYAVVRPILGADGYMLCYPGLTKVADGSGVDRGANYNERFANLFRVSGTKLVQLNTNGTINVLGSVPGTLQAAMPYSFNTQAVIADSRMFLYSPSGGFSEITDTDLGNPIDGVWVDGYYFLTDGEFIYHTDLEDESSIDPLKFATAEFMPDKSLGVGKTQDNKVIVFGRYTMEYFINRATANFAFERVPTRAQKIGIVATHAKCESGGKWYVTGGRKEDAVSVHIVTLGQAQKVSTREIDKLLAKYTEPQLADMRMESRTEDDVTFILIHLPNETLCFNETVAESFGKESAWSILKTDIAGDKTYRGINGVFDARRSQWVYGDKLSGNIGRLDNTVFTVYEEAIEWLLFSPFMKFDGMSVDEIEIETLPGGTSFEDATVAFSVTQDGLTYSKEWFTLYGEPQEYGRRFYQRRLGAFQDWAGFKFRGATKSRMSFATMKVRYG